jgi:hypothetical protein
MVIIMSDDVCDAMKERNSSVPGATDGLTNGTEDDESCLLPYEFAPYIGVVSYGREASFVMCVSDNLPDGWEKSEPRARNVLTVVEAALDLSEDETECWIDEAISRAAERRNRTERTIQNRVTELYDLPPVEQREHIAEAGEKKRLFGEDLREIKTTCAEYRSDGERSR